MIEKYNEENAEIPHFLADTCWFAMTRLSDEKFIKLVETRKQQEFTAIQIVVGIPPEVGIENENAKSICGYAYDIKGRINYDYLKFVKKRIQIMNNYGLTAIVYGAWGHQIDWIGTNKMLHWWKELINTVDKLDVIYCLTGEIDIWCEPILSKALLPDKTTKNLFPTSNMTKKVLKKIYNIIFNKSKLMQKRLDNWSIILKEIKKLTDKPIIIHTLPTSSGFSVVEDINLISANTFQTGHTKDSEVNIWKNIYTSKKEYLGKPVINLEPWYEGIFDDFYQEYQLKAFWFSVASGAHAICYGAQGIWNVGDGKFLSQWGNQNFDEALELDTPSILGKSYNMLLKYGVFDWNNVIVDEVQDNLISITRISKEGRKIIYIPEIKNCKEIYKGQFLDIKSVEFVSELPQNGPIVIFS